jgi:hypothetical protein
VIESARSRNAKNNEKSLPEKVQKINTVYFFHKIISSMKKNGTAESRESWRTWVLTLLALGFALLVITMLLQENKMLAKNIESITLLLQSPSKTYKEYPLHFDLPKGWIITEGCTATVDGEERHVGCTENIVGIESQDELPVLDRSIDAQTATIYIQNTNLLPLFGGIGPNEAVEDAYQSTDVALITVERITSEDVLLESNGRVTDLGEGFYKVNVCNVMVDGPECGMYGAGKDEYYFFGETGIYHMSYKAVLTGAMPEIEEIMLSAHE